MGLPDMDAGGPGGGGIGLPRRRRGVGATGRGRGAGRGGPPARGPRRPGGGRAAGGPWAAGSARGARRGALGGAGRLGRRGGRGRHFLTARWRGGRSLPDDVTSRPGRRRRRRATGRALRRRRRRRGRAGVPPLGRPARCGAGRSRVRAGAARSAAGASARAPPARAPGAGASAAPSVAGRLGRRGGCLAGAFAAFFVLLAAFVALVALTGLGSSGCSARGRGPRARLVAGRGRPAPPRCPRSASSPRCPGRGTGRGFPCSSSRAPWRARGYGSSLPKLSLTSPSSCSGASDRGRCGANHGPPSSRSPLPGHEHRLRNICGSVPTGWSATLAERSWERSATDGEHPAGVDRGPAEPRAATRKCTALDRSSIRAPHEADELGLAGGAPAADAGALRLGPPGPATARPARHRRARPPPRPRSRPLRRSR